VGDVWDVAAVVVSRWSSDIVVTVEPLSAGPCWKSFPLQLSALQLSVLEEPVVPLESFVSALEILGSNQLVPLTSEQLVRDVIFEYEMVPQVNLALQLSVLEQWRLLSSLEWCS
jgi:hypothetical protein